MGTLHYIFNYAISSMVIGVVITICGIAAFFLLIKGWYKDRTFNLASAIVGVILFVLLCFQNILLCGAVHIKRMSTEFITSMTEYVQPWVQAGNDYMEASDVDDILFDELAEKYPIISCYLGGSEFTGFKASEIPQATVDELNSYFNWYIFRRVCWELLFVVVGAVIVIKTMERHYSRRRSDALANHTGRGAHFTHDTSRTSRSIRRDTRHS